MSDVDPTTTGPIGDVINEAANIVNWSLIQLGVPLNRPQPAPTAPPPAPKINWSGVAQALNYDWPGYPWPSTFNPELVAALYSDVLSRLGRDGRNTYFLLLGQLHLLNVAFDELQAHANQLNGIASSQVAGGSPQELLNNINSIDSALGAIYGHFTTIVNILGQQINDNYQHFTTIVNLLGAQIGQNQTVVEQQIGQEAGARTAVDDQLGAYMTQEAARAQAAEAQIQQQARQDLTAEQARAQQTENQLQQQVSNETARATGVETNILGVAIPAAITGLATQVATQLQPIKDELTTCLDPLCDTVTPRAPQLGKLGQLLKNLEGFGLAAILAGLVVDAVANPDQASDAVIAAGGFVADMAVQLADAV